MKQEYAQRHLRAVELDKILQMLARETACKEAEELALAIVPETSLTAVEKMLQETDDAYVLMARFGSPSFGGLCSMENALRRAQAGAALLPSELLRLAALLRTLRGILDWRKPSDGWHYACSRRTTATSRHIRGKRGATRRNTFGLEGAVCAAHIAGGTPTSGGARRMIAATSPR